MKKICPTILVLAVLFFGLKNCRRVWNPAARNWAKLSDWATRETKYNLVTVGMTKKQVLSLMGAPDRRYRLAGKSLEEWSYEFPDGEGHIAIQFDNSDSMVNSQFGYD